MAHFPRAFKVLEGLAFLGDLKARQILVGWAEEQMHEYRAVLLRRGTAVRKHPQQGERLGRQQGHLLYLLKLGETYATTTETRESFQREAQRWLKVFALAQVGCTGAFMRVPTRKVYLTVGKPVPVLLMDQHAICVWGIWAWRKSFGHEEWYTHMVTRATAGVMDSALWDPGIAGLIWNVECAPLDWDKPAYCTDWPHRSNKREESHVHDLAAIAWRMTGNKEYAERMGPVPVQKPANAQMLEQALQDIRDGQETPPESGDDGY